MAKSNIKGEKVLFKVNIGGTDVIMSCHGDITMSITANTEEVICSDVEDEAFKQFDYSDKEYSLSMDGQMRYFTAPDAATNISFLQVLAKLEASEKLNFLMIIKDEVGYPTFAGEVLVTEFTMNLVSKGLANFSANMQGNGKYTRGVVAAVDVTNPTLSSSVPADGASGIVGSADIALTFSENMAKGYGYIDIFAGGALQERIDVESGQVSIAGAVVTINPTASIPSGAAYILITPKALKDANGNYYAGINSSTTLNFTVA